MLFNKKQLLNRQKQWDSFNSWESTFITINIEINHTNLLNWFDEAWKMAQEQNPDWINQEIDQDKLIRLQKTRMLFRDWGNFHEQYGAKFKANNNFSG